MPCATGRYEKLAKILILKVVTMEQIRHLKYSSYEHRLNTFENWSKSKMQTKQQIAEARFFYTNRKDLLMCFHCGLGLDDWSE